MVVKRKQAIEESEDEDDGFLLSSSPAKRVRLDVDNEDTLQERSLSPSVPAPDLLNDVESYPLEDDDEGPHERTNISAILNQEASREQKTADRGILISVEVINFMCHKHLKVDLNPHVNFIIGRNGSGKSALLAALQIALGARAYLTGRGANTKALIMEKKQVASIAVRLKNEGDDAFKPALYGDVITIFRSIHANGGGVWQLKNELGKVVGKRKSDLQELLDHMGIQIDSPLCILTQDAARQFLTHSTSRDKYAFFLKGTLLAQLAEDYELIDVNIGKINRALSQQKEELPAIRVAIQEAEAKLAEAQKAVDLKAHLITLRREFPWTLVAAKHAILLEQQLQLEKLERTVTKYEKKVIEAQGDHDAREAEYLELDEEIKADERLERPLQEELTHTNATLHGNRVKLGEFENEIYTVNNSLKDVNGLIGEVESQIAAASSKLRDEEAIKRDLIVGQLEETRLAIQQKQQDMNSLVQERRSLEAELTEIEKETKDSQHDLDGAKRELFENERYQNGVREAQNDKLNIFGKNVASIQREIQKGRWQGTVPFGPLGTFVSLKDQEYREVMQTTLGHTMSNFVVSNPADRRQLADILKRFDNAGQIIIAERDIFDYRRGIPSDPSIITPLHILDITDEWVKRILINAHGIERIGLAKTRKEAQTMAEQDTGRTFWSADVYRVMKYPDGGWTSVPMAKIGRNDSRRNLFNRSNDSDAELRRAQERHRDLETDIARIQNILSQKRDRSAQCKQELGVLETNTRNIRLELDRLGREQAGLEEQSQDEAPVEIASLEAQSQHHQTEKAAILKQAEIITQRRQEVEDVNRPLVAKARQLKERLEKLEEKKRGRRAELERRWEVVLQAKKTLRHYESKLDAATKAKDEHAQRLTNTENEHADLSERAAQETDGVQIETSRSPNTVQREIDELDRALKRQERRHGANLDEIEEAYEHAKAVLQLAEAHIEKLQTLAEKEQEALDIRRNVWGEFRKSITWRSKVLFQWLLSQRDYWGRLDFNHKANTLELHVQTDKAGHVASREKDPSSLSGGEKSYAQICLLLALWDSVSSSIRCLDEFEVCMDEINRTICMKLLMDHAKRSSGQHIFIAPLDANKYAKNGPRVKTQEMRPPDRGSQPGG